MTVARTLGFGENDEACAGINGGLSQAPHALQIRGAPHIGHRHVAETLHQPAVSGNLEMRLQFPPAHKLRNGAVQNEGVKQIDVVHEKETRPVGIETWCAADLDFCS